MTMQHPGDKKRRKFKERNGPVTVARKIRVTCNICRRTVTKLSYNVALHQREHHKHNHRDVPVMDFSCVEAPTEE